MDESSFCPPASTSIYDRQRLSAAAPMMPDLWLKIPAWPNVGGGGRIIIIGAGISGLCAAWGLRAAGFSPVVLERTNRAGGRIFTLRDYFGDQHVELGATRIPEQHPLPLAYARRFGLSLLEYPSDRTRQIYHVRGRRFESGGARGAEYPHDLGLTAEESRFDAEHLCDHYTAQALRVLSHPGEPEWPPAAAREVFQGKSVQGFLGELGASSAAQEIYRASSPDLSPATDRAVEHRCRPARGARSIALSAQTGSRGAASEALDFCARSSGRLAYSFCSMVDRACS